MSCTLPWTKGSHGLNTKHAHARERRALADIAGCKPASGTQELRAVPHQGLVHTLLRGGVRHFLLLARRELVGEWGC